MSSTPFPTTLVAAAVAAIVGVVCNIKGWHYDQSSKEALIQAVGLICEAVAAVLVWVHTLHTQTIAKVQRLLSSQEINKTPGKPLAIAAVVMLAFMSQGCQNLTPAQNVSIAEQGFTALTVGLNSFRQAGKIDDSAWKVVSMGIVAGNDYLDVLDQKVASGEITTNKQLLSSAAWLALQEVLNQLTAYHQKATLVQNGGSTTGPASGYRSLSTPSDDRHRYRVSRLSIYSRTTAADYRCAA